MHVVLSAPTPTIANAIGISSSRSSRSSTLQFAYLVTGANKGQGYALCQRILEEYDDTHVFLCSRNLARGQAAAARLGEDYAHRVDVVQLDVTDAEFIRKAVEQVSQKLSNSHMKLEGLVLNAGILWGHSLEDLLDVCAVGVGGWVASAIDAFLPLMVCGARIIVVSSGLGPLLHSHASPAHQEVLMNAKTNQNQDSWDAIQLLIQKIRQVGDDQGPEAFEKIGFPGGPFAERSAPEFNKYGLAKMFADAYMLQLAQREQQQLLQEYHRDRFLVHSCDPGSIGRMPRSTGKKIHETNGAKTPSEGVDVHMRLLFDMSDDDVVKTNGRFFAMTKDGKISSGPIHERPDV